MTSPSRARGSPLGPYVLEELIGTGPFAEVWAARHAHLAGKRLAIKVFTDERIREVLAKAGAVPWLDGSKYVPRLLDFRPCEDPPCAVTELVEGRSLRQVLSQEGPFTPRRAQNVMGELLGALKYAHHQGLQHTDLKSENVLLAGGDQVFLLDLAVGRFSVEASILHRQAKTLSSRAARGMRYRSRGQLAGGAPDERSDIFALGVLFFELLTGELPKGKQRPSSLAQHVPARLDKVYARCCTKVEKRYPSVLALEKELLVRHDVTPTTVQRRFQSMEVLDERTVLVSMLEVAAGRETIDGNNIEPIIKNMEYLEKSGFSRLVLDFTRITYISSTGFGYMVNLADAIRRHGGQAILYGIQPKVRMILDVLGLTRYFVMCKDQAEAKAALRG